ncbi:TIGR02569 family protein [Oerskovia enterophila]|uniref:TIGR02569 family protein n=1 Tax=Oerskovia enterophila TaxID=43678 RepID=UPI003394A1F0
MQPPREVLEAFDAVGPAVKVSGGRGAAWRAGDLVLKPLDVLPAELDWLRRHAPAGSDDLRLSLPTRSRTGELVVDGWTAFPVLQGEHVAGRWAQIAGVAHRFAQSFDGAERPEFLDERTHAWARADRLAWGEGTVEVPDDVPHLPALLAARRGVDEPSTIVHGDLTGNVLFDDDRPPAVIDLTLYWRPVRYSVAIVAVDAVCFEGAPPSLLETIDPGEGFAQHLVRALLFRIATDWFNGLLTDTSEVYAATVEQVLELASPGRRPSGRSGVRLAPPRGCVDG